MVREIEEEGKGQGRRTGRRKRRWEGRKMRRR
jgi:hypothetical protein